MNRPATTVEIAVPVYNEERILATSIDRLREHLDATFPFAWTIVIANNASTDGTGAVADRLAAADARVTHLALDRKGKGYAVRSAWERSSADVVAYTDVDLSTGLSGLLPLVAPLVSGHSDLSIGSRLSAGSSVARAPRRELISMAYNLLLRLVFAVKFRDAQCGFKAGRTEVIHALLPAVHDDAWFFDAELLLLAEHNGLRIHEVPVDWIDDPDSRVRIASTAMSDLRGVARMFVRFARGRGDVDLGGQRRPALTEDFGRQTVTFALIGAVATAVSLAIFVALRDPLGAVWANVVGFSATVLGNSWANRRWTFRHRRDTQRWRRRLLTLVLLALSLVATSIAVASVEDGGTRQVIVLAVTWVVAAIVRFVALRTLVRRAHPVR
jgi:putative flippase GtrA